MIAVGETDDEDANPFYPKEDEGPFATGEGERRGGNNRGFHNVFVNDPCMDPAAEDPFPTNFQRTVQSETEIAVLNHVPNGNGQGDDGKGGSGRLMVAGYNDSWGFYNNTQGLSGYAYSTDGGKNWIDGSGLPPIVKDGLPAGTPGQDAYFGDPVIVVHHRSKTFYYASIYQNAAGTFTLSVNRGHFAVVPPETVESNSNTRCAGDPSRNSIPDPPAFIRERIVWEPPVEAVNVIDPNDFLDKEWLYVDQGTGTLYLAYVRFASTGATPLELVRSFDGGHTWTPPSIIVPNLDDTFNTGVQPITTVNGRVIVSWWARKFGLTPPFPVVQERIELAYSDNDGVTFSSPVIVAFVNPQGEPLGYNRARQTISNMPYIAVDKGKFDGAAKADAEDRKRSSFGNVYITYFDGKTTNPQTVPGGCNSQNACNPFARAADIHLSTSQTNGTTWGPEVKVNDDDGNTSHIFPSVQVNKKGLVFVTWIDRRVDPANNLLNDTWGDISSNRGQSFDGDVRLTDVSTDWLVRADARPNFGDYNSSEVINFKDFASIWSDGRFPEGTFVDRGRTRRKATPDTIFEIFKSGKGGD